ncbi:3' terminal RNA ribose 2'-O-methyltransferase Hen1 [Sphaerisporangium krabiense]|uniref:Small RNA 2'-O-methyltransferase n=1 Tax=Sphaerisporangium krabiense TaxID=763782 RepID=A0A7W9DT46_9ACTN|nr:3' terminal RNA ribose 2'-O-methyltransferase Hen1 [Sphaerisporangium krabiense]MBB5630412.1 SAM-dependent methyltransferase [Sphaerisporangium krabiense]GII62635.1 3' terminal RNA ribose 2'-O-methyltransferase Hen1 [Sphaerisporangium krabiense]
MLLAISTTTRPATDLGFLLHKHPDRVQEFDQSFGVARVFYPEATADRCTAALMLDVDAVRLARSRGAASSPDFSLGQYVNDRPYAASSMLAVALADVFRTARAGICKARPGLAAGPIDLTVTVPVLPCRGGADLAGLLFEPLGWGVEATPIPLDERFPAWGDSRYVRLVLTGAVRLADALNHLYVLLPVLDDAKHYWIAPDEVDKLIRAGEGWLASHPERGRITRRYLGRRSGLTHAAFARLAEIGDDVEEDLEPPVEEEPAADTAEPAGEPAADPVEEPAAEAAEAAGEAPARSEARPLNLLRVDAVLAALAETGAGSVIDLGCGSGRLVGELLKNPALTRVTGADVSARALALAARRLRLDRMPEARRGRLTLFQGALTYTDARFAGYDAAVLMEVVEHVDPPRLPALERVVFGVARPRTVIVTTPNREYNARYEFLTGMRHPDHRFEWTRAEFADWAGRVCAEHGYRVAYRPVGEEDPELGPPTQMGVFTRD